MLNINLILELRSQKGRIEILFKSWCTTLVAHLYVLGVLGFKSSVSGIPSTNFPNTSVLGTSLL